jgi:cell division protein FtsI/penicillin-binding protein 2/cell division protein FtsW (lipid II flippase)
VPVDGALLLAVVALCAFGVVNLLSFGDSALAEHQAAAVVVGLLIMALALRSRSATSAWLGRGVYAFSVVLLFAVVVTGVHAFGAQRWLALGWLAFQPSELAKLGLLLVLAQVLGAEPPRRHRLLVALSLTAIPVGLTLVEPDLSTSLLLGLIALSVLVAARVRVRHVVLVLAALAAVTPVALRLLRPYQLARLDGFLHGGTDPHGAGWPVLQAHIAVASGGLLGGVASLPHDLLATYLPARESDMAFASLVEQRGLVFGAGVLVATAVLMWRLMAAASEARTTDIALVGNGLAVLIGIEVWLNVGGNLGVLPVAGVPCPFLSSGGSATVAHLAAIGLVMSGRKQALAYKLWRPPRAGRPHPRFARISAATLAAALAGLTGVAASLQRDHGAALRAIAVDQATRSLRLAATRGAIEDRHGVLLAEDDGSKRIDAIPSLLEAAPGGVERLAAALGEPPATVASALATGGDGLAVQVADPIAPATAAQVEAARLPGVVVTASGRRRYPYGPVLAPLLGFVGIATPDDLHAFGALPPGEIVGRAGLEREYDAVLRGRDGTQRVLVDRTSSPVAMADADAPQPGGTLRLSIDLGLQQAATSALETALRGMPGQPRGDEGAAIVMNAQTGELLAMASLPAYDDNVLGPPPDGAALLAATGQPGDPFLDHAIQTAAPPGSTFKLVVAAADVASGIVPPTRVVPTGSTFSYSGTVFHNWTALPPQDLPHAIAWSNDVYFYKLALSLGAEQVAAVAHQVGAGVATGVDLPGELHGLVGSPQTVGSPWYAGSTVMMGIGQGYIVVTPLQVARWTAAVATGTLVTPHLGLASEPSAGSGGAALPAPAAATLPFANVLGPVRDGLRLAVSEGTANQLRSLPMTAGGKTGTAEDPSTPSGGADAWFTAVAPIERPEVVVTVLVRGGGEGYYTAEPVAASLLRYYSAHRAAIVATAPMEQPVVSAHSSPSPIAAEVAQTPSAPPVPPGLPAGLPTQLPLRPAPHPRHHPQRRTRSRVPASATRRGLRSPPVGSTPRPPPRRHTSEVLAHAAR